MRFATKLKERVKSGKINTSIRIWKRPRVKLNGRYKLDNGEVVITKIREINLDDVSEAMARESGFMSKLDLLKTAKHGTGVRVFYMEFFYDD